MDLFSILLAVFSLMITLTAVGFLFYNATTSLRNFPDESEGEMEGLFNKSDKKKVVNY